MADEPIIDGQNDFLIENASLSTDRVDGGYSVNIGKLITDFEIYEHLDKPYLTGKVAFTDSYNIVQKFDFQGAEKLTISIKSNVHGEAATTITKEFYVEKIIRTQKVNQSTEIVFLRLIEAIAFESSVQNVNRAFTGTPTQIIRTIIQQYLDKDIAMVDDTFQGTIKLIVPNLHPLEAALWVKNRATNADGLPYYMYSVLADDQIRVVDLGTMLTSSPINTKYPYTYSQAETQRTDYGKHTVIQNYDYVQTEDLLKLIRKGYVGAKYNFIDTSTGITQSHDFSVDIDAFDQLAEKDYFKQKQPRYNYGPEYKYNETPISNYQSRIVTQISGAGSYSDQGFKTLQQESDIGAHKKKIVGNALKNFMTKSPLTIQVSGRDFISGKGHYTIGNTIRIIFRDNIPDKQDGGGIDTKKSGDYIVYAARHMFSTERYDCKLLCAKLASYVEGGAQ